MGRWGRSEAGDGDVLWRQMVVVEAMRNLK